MKYTQYEDWTDYKNMFQEQFTLEQSYVICGVGDGFRVLQDMFPETKVQYCLDAKALSLPGERRGVFPYEVLAGREPGAQKFIITAGSEYFSEIRNCLLHYGAQAEHIASLQEILFFWGIRYRKQFLTSSCAVVLLTHCNLKCKSCVHFIPYIKHFTVNSLESIKEDLEQYFRVFDFTKELILSGGEPMLYQELGELCRYIRTRFSKRYHELKINTNGLIEPKEEAIAELSKLDGVHIFISDYTCSIDKEQNVLIRYLEKYQVPYEYNSTFSQSAKYQWFDLSDPARRNDGEAGAAVERFHKCSLSCHYPWKKKVYYCGPAWSATANDLAPLDAPEVCLDLKELEHMSLEEKADRIGRFHLGFEDKGRLEFCCFCNGYGKDVNTRFVRAGEQC